MFRSHQYSKESNIDPDLCSDTTKAITQKPMFGKMLEIVLRAPHMRQADAAAFRKYMSDHAPFIDVPEKGKSAARAAQVRQEGNRLYLARDFDKALKKYNKSICFAENGSEDLGMGYANRSAIYYEMGEYEFALANIAMAKRNHYPDKLKPKLLAREQNCKEKINQETSNDPIPNPRMNLNVDCNPRIPFLAKGIGMKITSEFGRGLYAEKDFRPGDVLLSEKPMLAAIDSSLKYLDCAHCSIVHFNSLIPCPGCTSFMYCSEECLEQDRKTHRFECGVAEKLQFISCGNLLLGPRLFFYGLNLFGDNLKEMMEYCQSQGQTGGNPLELNYANYDPLEEFKEFHKTKASQSSQVKGLDNIFQYFSAAYYSVFIKHPLVKELVRTKHEEDFMLKSFVDYMTTASFLAFDKWECYASPLGMIATVVNHSCDPNAVATIHSGKIKIVTLRPIEKNEQIFISYGPVWWESNELKCLASMAIGFECRCIVCDPARSKQWRASRASLPPSARVQWKMVLLTMLQSAKEEGRTKLSALRQYVEDYADCHPNEKFNNALKMYQEAIKSAIMADLATQQRAEVAVGLL